ncbi:MAG TPA: thiamine pyrophosphate-dependent dehydrogenase E1 component subunit alpha [Chloroflexota bacterium]|nr:thiamine pyrophosphate-dependent dehydrogenase E1 component subunit alpha [Chloroflexota bacterium]
MATATTGRGRPVASSRRRFVPVHRQFGLADADVVAMYYAMLVSRRVSEQALKLAFQGAIDVSIPADGHEAAQIASMWALRPTDPAYLFYRSAPAAYARGMTTRELFLDYFGRADGPSSGGKNLAGHWAKRELNLMSMSGSVATQIPHAVGSALAAKLRGEDTVSVAYFGDGGSSKSDFHEGLNFAAVRQLPVVLFCENNGMAISVPFSMQSGVRSVADRAVGYALVGISVDGSDPLQVYRIMREAVDAARAGKGPALIEARVTRLGQHTSQVGEMRPAREMAAARRKDPIPLFGHYLRHHGVLDERSEAALKDRADAEVLDAVEFARRAPPPPVERAFQDVYGPALTK